MYILNPYVFSSAAPSFLDQVVSPVCGFGLRRKISTYSGPCLKVRRDGGSPASMDIPFLGDVIDSATLISFVGSNNGFVVDAYDQTGGGKHASQATASKQPKIINAGAYTGRIAFDGVDDCLVIASLTMGGPAAALYFKASIAGSGSTAIYFEMSSNYNNNVQSFVVYRDSTGGGPLFVSSRNSTTPTDIRNQGYNATSSLLTNYSVLFDRSIVGSTEIQVNQGGNPLTGAVIGTPAEQTGNYSAYDLHIGARNNGGSLAVPFELESLFPYNSDTLALRATLDAIMA